MLRKLALSLAIAGALGTSNAYALGLGEIKITSALNEPLKAEIQLLQMREVDPQQIQPSMANIDDFALAGIEKLRFLSDVKFEVKSGSSGRGTIVMTSSAVVKEPFLNFLVEVNWPSGRLVREYTVLLDPPVYDPSPAPVATQPARSAATPASAPVSAKPLAPKKPTNNIRTRMTDGQVYVDVNDTLWLLAKRHKPNAAISEAQMMVALQRKNPEAFSNNNVNQLKAGVVLDLPSEDEIKVLSQKQANEEFWRQTQMWKQGIVNPTAPVQTNGTATDDEKKAASGKKGEEVAAKTAEGQLKIVSPDTTAEAGTVSDQAAQIDTSTADAALLEKNKQLETELASALETVDQIKRENEELSGRVDALAQQMESLHRLVELKDQQLVDLQVELEAAKQQSAAASVTPVSEAQPKGLLERFGLYIGAAGGAIVAFLLALLLLRRGKKEEPVAEPVPESNANVDEQPEEEAVVVAAEPEEIEEVEEDNDLDDLDLDLDMDLDKIDEVDEQSVDEDEFDLGFDDAPAESFAEEVEEVEDVDDALDSILGEETESLDLDDLDADPLADSLADIAEEEPELDSLEDLLAGVEDSDDAADDIEFNVAPTESAVEELVDDVDGLSEDELDLDFDLDMADTEIATSDDAEDEQALGDMLAEDETEIDDLDALLAGTDEVAEAPSEESEDDFADLEDLLGQETEMSDDDIDDDLSELLAGVEEADVEELAVTDASSDVDLDPDLAALLNEVSDDEIVLDEETISASDDLDAELDSELEMLLSDAGGESLDLDETDDSEDDSLDGLNLLEGADEVETKLDLARAYLDMEDFDGAKDILQEILKEGSDAQQSEANSLLGSINS